MQRRLHSKNVTRQVRERIITTMKNGCFRICFVIGSVGLGLLSQVDLFVEHGDAQTSHRMKTLRAHGENEKSTDASKEAVLQLNHSSVSNGNNPTKFHLADMVDPETFQLNVDFSDIIDFAIVGNPKTGTTFMLHWFRSHPELLLPPEEMRLMLREKRGPGKAITALYPLYQLQVAPQKIGYKCPADIRELAALGNLRDYFPKTKLIVSIRHPVWWFQSFYNFRIRFGFSIPSPMNLRGPCLPNHWKTCTHNAYFHLFLAQMGQTSLSSRSERDLLRHYDVETLQALPYNLTVLSPPSPHSVFLLDQSQLDGMQHADIAEAVRMDLSTYLGLTTPLPSLEGATQVSYATTTSTEEKNITENMTLPSSIPFNATREGNIMNICDSQFQSLREELVLIGRDTAAWILEYFLPLPHVHVSSPDFFREVLQTYKTDPCKIN